MVVLARTLTRDFGVFIRAVKIKEEWIGVGIF